MVGNKKRASVAMLLLGLIGSHHLKTPLEVPRRLVIALQ